MSINDTSKVTIKEIIEHFSTSTDKKIPFKNSQMIAAVGDAALAQDKNSLEQLLDSTVGIYVKLNPEKPREIMERYARELVVMLAYFADHNPSPIDYMKFGPIKAYQSPLHYGTAMSLVKQICDSRKIDIMRDVFAETDSSLN